MSKLAVKIGCDFRQQMIKYAHTKEKIHSVQKKKASTHIVSGIIVTLRVYGIVVIGFRKDS